MTQEQEARDILENYCGAHDVVLDEHVLRLMDWFSLWKNRNDNPPDLGVSVSEEVATEDHLS